MESRARVGPDGGKKDGLGMATSDGPVRRPLLGILFLAVSLLIGLSLLSSPPWPGVDPFPGLPRDACGLVGRLTAQFLLEEMGIPLAIWGALLGFSLGLRLLFLRPRRPWAFLLWGVPTALAISLFFGILSDAPFWGRGPLSMAHVLASSQVLGPVGSTLLTGALLVLLLVLGATRLLPARALEVGRDMAGASGKATPLIRRLFGRRRDAINAGTVEAGASKSRSDGAREPRIEGPRWLNATGEPATGATGADASRRDRAFEDTSGKNAAGKNTIGNHTSGSHTAGNEGGEDPTRAAGAAPSGLRGLVSRATQGAGMDKGHGSKVTISEGGRAGERPTEAARRRSRDPETPPVPNGDGYVLPPVALLEPGEPPLAVNQSELLETSKLLVRTLRDFGIQGQVGQIHPGPVITQYEYEPAAGVKVAQIVSRSEDLALALRASRIRLVAPIPGKAAVGIEIPNRSAATISLRSVLEEVDIGAIPGELPLVCGRDIRGRPFAERLEQMPHLLVAGTTGSGKSVFLNCALLSLLLRRTPEDLRLLLIDPKMLELTPYDGIPHLVCPVVTEAKVAAKMLIWAVGEMEQRYRRLAAVGVRNLEGYRARARGPRGAAEGLEPMPHLVIIVDELADLMLTLANEIEGSIARLAQMARAVGIHLVLATQRPSVDVITGVIKANFPARIAFQVASKVDSRTILDANGAESLLGKGDMLFLPPGKAEAVRVHGAYVSEKDTESVAAFLRQQPPPPPLFRAEALHRDDGDIELGDELFDDALRLIVLQKQASVSFLQRRLKVGYSRAGRLMDLLEQAGAVGAQDGSKTREVLADEHFLERHLEETRSREVKGAPQTT